MAFFSPGYTNSQKNLLSLMQNTGENLFGQAGNLYDTISGGYNNILANPGYTPSQVSNLYSGALQPISGAYGSAAGKLGATAASSRNDAGLYSGAAALAQKAAQDMGTAASKTAFQVADYPRQQTLQALQGLGNLYSPTLSAGTNLYSTSNANAGNPTTPSGFSDLLGSLGAAGGLMTGLGSMGLKPFAAAGISGASSGGAPGYMAGRAKGGPVKKNKPYLVGEEGPELFVPGKKGRILSHDNLYRAA